MRALAASEPPAPDAPPPRRVAVALAHGMSLSSALLAVEPLRSVNRFLHRPAYAVAFVGPDAAPVTTGIGLAVTPDAVFDDPAPFALVVAASARDQPAAYRKSLFGWLRRQARAGAELVGADYGAVFLAEAGLLDGRRATTHWEVRPSVAARFPEIDWRDEIFVIDGPRMTCGGHLACHDLFLAVVERDHGAAAARFVAADLVAGPGRPGATRQGDPLTRGAPVADARLRRLTERMEATLDAPLPVPALAAELGLSVRHLQTLARRHLGETASERYLAIRLNAARNMLMYDEAPVTEVALACGFGSASAFSRAFRARFRTPPRTYRADFRRAQARPCFFPPAPRLAPPPG